MRKILLFTIAIACISLLKAQTLTSGNIVVLRIGDSTATLANTGNTLALDQFTTAGTYVNSILLPKTGTNAVCLSGTATSEGMLSLSTGNNAVVLFAYNAAAPYASSISATTSATVARTIVAVSATGTITLPTSTSTGYSGNNPRTAVSDGTGFWGAGANTGISYGVSASNKIDTVVSSTSVNIRSLGIFNGQLFYTSASGTSGVYRAGSGTPTNSGNVSYVTLATGTGSSPYGFAMRNDSNVCYIADDRAVASGGGIQKWTRTNSSTAWTLTYTLPTGTGSTVGARGLVVNWNTKYPTIIATTAEASANRVIRLIDTNATVSAITLATAPANTIFRGVTYTPGSGPLPVNMKSFNGTILGTEVNLTWSTASEQNNNYFNVERSFDGTTFEVVGKVKGNNTANRVNNYNFKDVLPAVYPQVFYRLNQVDLDGAEHLSEVLSLNNQESSDIQITPNPFSNEIRLNSGKPSAEISAELVDLNGRVQKSIVGMGSATLSTDDIAAGVYFLRVKQGDVMHIQRIVKN